MLRIIELFGCFERKLLSVDANIDMGASVADPR